MSAFVGLASYLTFLATWLMTDSLRLALACQLTFCAAVLFAYMVSWRIEFGRWWFK